MKSIEMGHFKCAQNSLPYRKITVAVWYAPKDFIPEILDAEKELNAKLKKVAEELSEPFIKKLGYKDVNAFREEYLLVLLSNKALSPPNRNALSV